MVIVVNLEMLDLTTTECINTSAAVCRLWFSCEGMGTNKASWSALAAQVLTNDVNHRLNITGDNPISREQCFSYVIYIRVPRKKRIPTALYMHLLIFVTSVLSRVSG